MANYTSVVASNICDAAGNKLAAGTVSLQATDAGNQPINFQVGGGGQVVTTPTTATITNGAIVGGLQVADSANTSPAGILYRITITDTTLNRVVATYSLVTVTGTTFSIDNYSQTGAAVLPPTGGSVNGPLVVTGNLSVTGAISSGSFSSGAIPLVPTALTNAAIQAAIDASPDGGEVYLPAGTYAITGTITISKRITLRGAGWGTILQVGAGVGSTTDVFLLKPSTSTDVQGMRFQDFAIIPQSGTPGRYAFNIDGTNASIAYVIYDHVRVDTLGNYALAINNVTGINSSINGTPYTTVIRACLMSGGLSLQNAGDSINIESSTFNGPRDITVNAVGAALASGGAHGFRMVGNNITTVGGVVIQNAWQGLFAYNNFESPTSVSTETNNALLDIQGNASGNVQNFKVIGNYLGANNLYVADALRVDRATATIIKDNLVSQGSGVCYRITANAVRTYFGDNRQLPDNPTSGYLADSGTATFGDFIQQATGIPTRYGSQAFSSSGGVTQVHITPTQIKAGAASGEIGFASGDPSATGIDVWLSRIQVGQMSLDKTAFNVSDGSLVQTGGIDLGTVQVKRLRTNRGTPLVAGDFALSAGWGVGATVTNVVGTDQAWTCTVTAAGTPAANPTLTLTFHDGAWPSSLSPITVTKMTGGTGAITNLTESPTGAVNIITFNGTPVAASTYIISSVALGR